MKLHTLCLGLIFISLNGFFSFGQNAITHDEKSEIRSMTFIDNDLPERLAPMELLKSADYWNEVYGQVKGALGKDRFQKDMQAEMLLQISKDIKANQKTEKPYCSDFNWTGYINSALLALVERTSSLKKVKIPEKPSPLWFQFTNSSDKKKSFFRNQDENLESYNRLQVAPDNLLFPGEKSVSSAKTKKQVEDRAVWIKNYFLAKKQQIKKDLPASVKKEDPIRLNYFLFLWNQGLEEGLNVDKFRPDYGKFLPNVLNEFFEEYVAFDPDRDGESVIKSKETFLEKHYEEAVFNREQLETAQKGLEKYKDEVQIALGLNEWIKDQDPKNKESISYQVLQALKYKGLCQAP